MNANESLAHDAAVLADDVCRIIQWMLIIQGAPHAHADAVRVLVPMMDGIQGNRGDDLSMTMGDAHLLIERVFDWHLAELVKGDR